MPKFRDAPKSEMDSQRELLDQLMGINRNQDREEDEVSDFRDDRVCKDYLCGLCVHDLFNNTKMDMGTCPKIHSDDFKRAFDASTSAHRLRQQYEAKLEKELLTYVTDADRKIKRARERLDDDRVLEDNLIIAQPEVMRTEAAIQLAADAVEEAVNNDDIDKAQELMKDLEKLQQERSDHITRILEHNKITNMKTAQDVNEKLRVCDICGAYLSIYDSDKRLIDHFAGKQHLGYQLIRDKLRDMQRRRKEEVSQRQSDSAATRNDKKEENEAPAVDKTRDEKRRRSPEKQERTGDKSGDRARDRSRDRRGDNRGSNRRDSRSRDTDKYRRRRSSSRSRENRRDKYTSRRSNSGSRYRHRGRSDSRNRRKSRLRSVSSSSRSSSSSSSRSRY